MTSEPSHREDALSEAKRAQESASAEPMARAPIRRFDVFAEYNRRRNQAKGTSDAIAKGEAIWLAKVVAARKFARTAERKAEMQAKLTRKPGVEGPPGAKVREGKPRTAEVFDREIVDRMGPEFYGRVFAPAIARANNSDEKYEAIRDRIRGPGNADRMCRR